MNRRSLVRSLVASPLVGLLGVRRTGGVLARWSSAWGARREEETALKFVVVVLDGEGAPVDLEHSLVTTSAWSASMTVSPTGRPGELLFFGAATDDLRLIATVPHGSTLSVTQFDASTGEAA